MEILKKKDELYHYGVKGMKWGVRRQIANKAKVAATMERSEKYYNKVAKKSLTKQQRLQNKRIRNFLKDPYSDKFSKMSEKEKKLWDSHLQNKELAAKMKEYRSHTIKDLSEKDINQGRRWIYKANIIFGLPFAVARHERMRAEKYIYMKILIKGENSKWN